jgi:hypothetical protein
MYRKFFVCMALCGLSSVAHAQQTTQGYLIQPIPNATAAVPANAVPVQAPPAFASPTPTTGAFAIGAPNGNVPVRMVSPNSNGPVTVMSRQPHPVVPRTLVHPVPIAPGQGTISGMAPLPTAAVTSTWTGNQVTRQTQIYTPTYYYYYYQPPYQVTQMTPVYAAPSIASLYVSGYAGGGYQTAGPFGPMMNARGEMGHIRLPYYSYRRPWYYPGQPSFNVTIPGPVW